MTVFCRKKYRCIFSLSNVSRRIDLYLIVGWLFIMILLFNTNVGVVNGWWFTCSQAIIPLLLIIHSGMLGDLVNFCCSIHLLLMSHLISHGMSRAVSVICMYVFVYLHVHSSTSRSYWRQRADERLGDPPPQKVDQGAFSGLRQGWKTPKRTLWQCTASVCVVKVKVKEVHLI